MVCGMARGTVRAPVRPHVKPGLKQTVIDGLLKEARGQSVEQLANEVNDVMLGILELRGRDAGSGPTGSRGGPTPQTREIHHEKAKRPTT
jgi:hypothetical protein